MRIAFQMKEYQIKYIIYERFIHEDNFSDKDTPNHPLVERRHKDNLPEEEIQQGSYKRYIVFDYNWIADH